jgi:hypothetical protein
VARKAASGPGSGERAYGRSGIRAGSSLQWSGGASGAQGYIRDRARWGTNRSRKPKSSRVKPGPRAWERRSQTGEAGVTDRRRSLRPADDTGPLASRPLRLGQYAVDEPELGLVHVRRLDHYQ